MWRRALTLALLLALVAAPLAHAQNPPGALITLQNAATTTGVGASMTIGGFKTVALQLATTGGGNAISGQTYGYRVAFQGSLDLGIAATPTWSLITCYPQGSATGATAVSTTTSESGVNSVLDRSMWRCNVAGYRGFRSNIILHGGSGLTITVKAVGLPDAYSLGALTP